MKIGIDVSCLSKRKTGIGYYTYYLIRGLSKIDKGNKYYLFSSKKFTLKLTGDNFTINFSSFPGYLHAFWEQFWLPFEAFKYKVQLLHSPNYSIPLLFSGPTIITIHDLSVCLFAQTHPWLRRLKHNLLLSPLIKRASKIITVSENSKKDVKKLFGIPEEKIAVIYHGVSSDFHPISDQNYLESIRRKYNLPHYFILYVGTLEPRKNIPTLLKAFSLLRNKKNVKHKLVIVGKKGWQYKEIFDALEKLNLKNDVVFTGYLPEEDLPAIYNLADLFTYPSLYEGFGLPPLEAMACGCPVITSNTSSLPEVTGNAALLVNPHSRREIYEGMDAILSNHKLRNRFIEDGIEQSRKFSWEETARRTLKVYEGVCKN